MKLMMILFTIVFEKVGDLLIDTFESSINMIDEPADFKEKLEDAVKNL